jgi:MOSC domain-containing protein YiiM
MAHVSLFIGQVQPLPVSGRLTAMYKTQVHGSVELGIEGFARTTPSWPHSLPM